MLTKNEITGIILVGGKSSRMGRDKGLCEFKNRSLVEYSINALKQYCGEILISTNIKEGYSKYGFPLIADEYKEIGPLGGIYSCLKKSQTKHNLILSCDTPFIGPQLIKFIIENIDHKHDVILPSHGDSFLEPLCAYYNSSIIADMESFIKTKDYKLIRFVKSVNYKALLINQENEFYRPELFNNFNTMEDLLSSK